MGICLRDSQDILYSYYMYSDFWQASLDLYRKHLGFLVTRERFKARKDSFYEFNPIDDNQADQQTLRRLSNSIVEVSDRCFKQCISVQYPLFTTEEQACVKRCTRDYFEGYEQIARESFKVGYASFQKDDRK